MSTNDDSDDLSVESLSKTKEDIFKEHGLDGTTLDKARERKEAEEQEAADKRARLVELKTTLAVAEQRGLGDDPDVEALRADIHDMSAELEAESLRAQRADEVAEARKKIDNLEGLAQRAASQNQDRLAANYRQRAASLKSEFPALEDDDDRFDVEALKQTADDSEDAEALQEFQEFQDRKQQEAEDEDLPDDVKDLMSQYKQMKAQASTDSLREVYQSKIDDLRAEHSE